MIIDPTEYTKRDLYLSIPNLKKRGVAVCWTQEMVDELHKCATDIEHFARNYVYIVTLDHGKTLMNPTDEQLRVWKAFDENRFVIWVAGRQTFKTTTTSVWLLHSALFNNDYRILISANKLKTARGILGKIREIYRNLPMWMQPGVVEWNKSNVALDNGTSLVAEATTASAARGESANIAYVDEMAFIDNDVEFMTSVFPIISSGSTSKFIMTSTFDGVANEFYRYWVDANEGKNGFYPVETKWDSRPDRDEKFKQEMIAKIGKQKWLQEFENVAIAANMSLVDITSAPLAKAVEPISEDANTKVYRGPEHGHKYIVAADVSYGTGKDYSVAQVLDITSWPLRQVAIFRSNEINPTHFAGIIVNLAKKYNMAHVVIETNDIGQITAQSVYMDHEYENVIIGNMKSYTDFGVKMTSKVKNVGCATLKELLSDGHMAICDKTTLDEIASFERRGNSWAAKAGYHDDTVMPLVMISWLTKNADTNWLFGGGETTINATSGAESAPDDFILGSSADEDDVSWLIK